MERPPEDKTISPATKISSPTMENQPNFENILYMWYKMYMKYNRSVKMSRTRFFPLEWHYHISAPESLLWLCLAAAHERDGSVQLAAGAAFTPAGLECHKISRI